MKLGYFLLASLSHAQDNAGQSGENNRVQQDQRNYDKSDEIDVESLWSVQPE